MVSVALLAVIIVGLLAMFYQVQRAFRSGVTQSDVMEGGRATTGLIIREAQEISATYLGAVTNFGVVPSVGAAPGAPTSSQGLSGGVSRDNFLRDFFFLSRQNDEWVGISYRISNAVSGVGTLYRLIERQPLTNLFLLATNIAVVTPYNNTNFHRVMDGVVHFNIEVFDTNGAPYPDPPAPGPYLLGPNNELLGYSFVSNALPAYVDLQLAVIEPAALEKFNSRFDLDTPPYMRSAAYLSKQAPRTHVFRQRVPIRAAMADTGVGP